MTTKIIVLRGNIASGKSTVAKNLRSKLGVENALIVSQDILSREILPYKDGEISVPYMKVIIEEIIKSANEINYPYLILEGIWLKRRYGDFFEELVKKYKDNNFFFYYFDISLDETLNRDTTRAGYMSKEKIKSSYTPKDFLENIKEEIIDSKRSCEEITQRIIKEMGKND